MESNNKKFYILNSSGEMESYSIVELTDEEYAVIKKIFKESYDNTVVFDDYSANTYLYDKGFDTKEEAIACINYMEHAYPLDSFKVPEELYLMDEKVRERDY